MKPASETTVRRIHAMTFAKVYPMYIAKAENKGRSKAEVDTVIYWLTGYTAAKLSSQIKKQVNLEQFFREAPKLNPLRKLITGTVCGVRVETVADEVMRDVRYLDKLVDELAKGWPLEKSYESLCDAERFYLSVDYKIVEGDNSYLFCQ